MAKVIQPMHVRMHMMDFWERRNKSFEQRNTSDDVSSIEEISKMIKVIDPDGSKMAAIHRKYYCENVM
ncbi:MAG: hypothetical protein ACKUBY_03575 [Candidatus Moraniibacteriota bacterium]